MSEIKVEVRRTLFTEVWLDLDVLRDLSRCGIEKEANEAADEMETVQWEVRDSEIYLSPKAIAVIEDKTSYP